MNGRHGITCCVYGCGNNQSKDTNSFFLLPNERIEPDRLAEWLSLIGRGDLLGYTVGKTHLRVCCDHFSKEQYKLTKKLKRNVVPCKNLPVFTKKEPEPGPSTSKHDTPLQDFYISHTNQDVSTQTVIGEMKNSSSQTESSGPMEFGSTNSISEPFSHSTTQPKLIIDATQTPLLLTTNTPTSRKRKHETKLSDSNELTLIEIELVPLEQNDVLRNRQEETDLTDSNELKVLEPLVQDDVIIAAAAEAPATKEKFFELCDQFLDQNMSRLVKCHVSLMHS